MMDRENYIIFFLKHFEKKKQWIKKINRPLVFKPPFLLPIRTDGHTKLNTIDTYFDIIYLFIIHI